VLFDGAGMKVRPKGAKNSNDLNSDFTWRNMVTCLSGGGGVGADCAGHPYNGFRYDTPTWAGFGISTGYYEDDVWDVAVKYAADWNSVKFSAAVGYTQETDEGCGTVSSSPCTNATILGGGGAPHQNFRKDAQIFQVGASVMHVPSGLFVYGLYQREQNDGTQWQTVKFDSSNNAFKLADSNVNESDVWYIKAGIKRAWMPAGATVLFGEWGQYNDQFSGICDKPSGNDDLVGGNDCQFFLPVGSLAKSSSALGFKKGDALTESAVVTGSEVTRYGIGVVQEIDSAAMHVFARWQHLDLDVTSVSLGLSCVQTSSSDQSCATNGKFGDKLKTDWEGLDIFQIGGVIFF
jgi:hypothetical protein